MTIRIDLPDAELRRAETIGGLFRCVVSHAGQPLSATGDMFSGPLWEGYLDVIEKETGANRRDLRSEAGFIKDLGLE
jgi:hypothetical protein